MYAMGRPPLVQNRREGTEVNLQIPNIYAALIAFSHDYDANIV